MIAKYNRRSIAIVIPSFVVQTLGFYLINETHARTTVVAGFIIAAIGLAMFAAALAYYAMAKKRHPLYGILGFFWFIGLAALAALQDKSVRMIPIYCQDCGYNLHGLPTTTCPECGHLHDDSESPPTPPPPLTA